MNCITSVWSKKHRYLFNRLSPLYVNYSIEKHLSRLSKGFDSAMTRMPFRYGRILDSFVVTNESGQFYFLEQPLFSQFISDPDALPFSTKQDLESKFFLAQDDCIEFALEESAIKLRTKKSFLSDFTALHIIVLTYACNSKCIYCQASSSADTDEQKVMSITTARRICEWIMQSPSPNLKIEFQGGEPTLEFDTMVFIVEYLNALNLRYKKCIEFVVCTNLLVLSEQQLQFFKKHNFDISTSLDGPQDVHDKNRTPLHTQSNYERMVQNYSEFDRVLTDKVSALLTVSIFIVAIKGLCRYVCGSRVSVDLHQGIESLWSG